MIPNIITSIRLISTIPLALYIYFSGIHNMWPLVFFILIIITDFLDGYIARHYNMVTELGKVLDPIVDKCLVIFTTIALLLNKTIPFYSLFIYIRDIIVAIGGYVLMYKKKMIIPADIFGKIKTVLHFLALAVVLYLGKWNIYSLILLILGLLTLIPEAILVYKKYLNPKKEQING